MHFPDAIIHGAEQMSYDDHRKLASGIEAKMDMDESMTDGRVETFPTLIVETSAVGLRFNVRPKSREAVARKVKSEADPDGSRSS